MDRDAVVVPSHPGAAFVRLSKRDNGVVHVVSSVSAKWMRERDPKYKTTAVCGRRGHAREVTGKVTGAELCAYCEGEGAVRKA